MGQPVEQEQQTSEGTAFAAGVAAATAEQAEQTAEGAEVRAEIAEEVAGAAVSTAANAHETASEAAERAAVAEAEAYDARAEVGELRASVGALAGQFADFLASQKPASSGGPAAPAPERKAEGDGQADEKPKEEAPKPAAEPSYGSKTWFGGRS